MATWKKYTGSGQANKSHTAYHAEFCLLIEEAGAERAVRLLDPHDLERLQHGAPQHAGRCVHHRGHRHGQPLRQRGGAGRLEWLKHHVYHILLK